MATESKRQQPPLLTASPICEPTCLAVAAGIEGLRQRRAESVLVKKGLGKWIRTAFLSMADFSLHAGLLSKGYGPVSPRRLRCSAPISLRS